MKLLLLHKKVVLKKMNMKGGWTYAELPNVLEASGRPFGWVMADVVVDNVELNDSKLMPMKNGNLFLALNATLRKKIGKEAGDSVQIMIYANNKINK